MSWQPEPDFNRLLKALRREQPDRVPLCELLMDAEAKEAFLGRPVQTVADDVEFWYRAGYDYIGLAPKFSFAYWRGEKLEDDLARYERIGASSTPAWCKAGRTWRSIPSLPSIRLISRPSTR